MGCCGDKTRARVAGEIVEAYARHFRAKIIGGRDSAEYIKRYSICRHCEYRTWLSRKERAAWLMDNAGGIIKYLHKVPDVTSHLPANHIFREGDALYCQVCRCKCIVKARLPNGECCKGLWQTSN